MNHLKYGEIAVGAPYSQMRFESLCLDLRNVDPSTSEWTRYAEEIARHYPAFKATVQTENGYFRVESVSGTLRIEQV